MACTIVFKDGGFQATTGQQFKVDVQPPAGGGLGFAHIIYGSGTPATPPCTLTVVKGITPIHVYYAPSTAAQQGKTFKLVEVCGGTTQTLAADDFDFSEPHFATQIEGV
jgi:hypothetical protein